MTQFSTANAQRGFCCGVDVDQIINKELFAWLFRTGRTTRLTIKEKIYSNEIMWNINDPKIARQTVSRSPRKERLNETFTRSCIMMFKSVSDIGFQFSVLAFILFNLIFRTKTPRNEMKAGMKITNCWYWNLLMPQRNVYSNLAKSTQFVLSLFLYSTTLTSAECFKFLQTDSNRWMKRQKKKPLEQWLFTSFTLINVFMSVTEVPRHVADYKGK